VGPSVRLGRDRVIRVRGQYAGRRMKDVRG